MKEIVDVVAIILFILVLFVVIGGFNRQMIEKNKERTRVAKEREEMKKSNTTKVTKEEK
ncbi:MAG: hypothetical protein HY307_01075 [Arcobacter sp.]|nr:hypothetical protein [Arcobacter sp.]